MPDLETIYRDIRRGVATPAVTAVVIPHLEARLFDLKLSLCGTASPEALTMAALLEWALGIADLWAAEEARRSKAQRLLGVTEVPPAVGQSRMSAARGDRVRHPKFGKGEVIRVDGNKLTIRFDTVGEKQIVDAFVRQVREQSGAGEAHGHR